jgi:hypothetical protein
MLALHRRVGSDEDMFIRPSVVDEAAVPYESMLTDAVRLIITLFNEAFKWSI